MKNMKSWLKLVGGAVVVLGTSSSVAACTSDTAVSNDISTGVTVEDIHTAADSTSTYAQLNWFTGITDIVDAAIQNVFGVSVRDGIDFILTNDQAQDAFEAAGTLVTFTVTAIDSLLNSNSLQATDNPNLVGKFSFTDTLSAANVSYGVTVPDQSIPYADNTTFYSLNSNAQLYNAVITAIKQAKNVTVAYNTDFKLTNDNEPSAFVKKGDKIKMIVVAMGSKIKGAFGFNLNIT